MHEFILASIILGAGILAALANYFKTKGNSLNNEGYFWKSFFTSLGASLLVPLLLNMLSSSLIKSTDNYDTINYFVFAGFCFVAGYYADKFINTVGDKILKDLASTNAKAETALDKVEQNEDKIDSLISSETESEDEVRIASEIDITELKAKSDFNDKPPKEIIKDIIMSFSGNYKFRTVQGITKELKYPYKLLEIFLQELQNNGVIKKLVKNDGKEVWGLTNIGRNMLDQYNK
ncbi:YEATS-associated helix-containing protein [Flavobacterium psychrotrophum]|uniref:YEATS-associated helix-containing protein n=1 Tax=Flavobacterium psychrotrophum TaxID=2294119 RepID=UPI000E3109B7|nr:YEATS-associated helix-containing protein [Flavobacterium psychrotrophum]